MNSMIVDVGMSPSETRAVVISRLWPVAKIVADERLTGSAMQVADRVAELCERWKVGRVSVDPVGPGRLVIDRLSGMGIKVGELHAPVT